MVKKGQAAMEFLMTYGWAILVVLAAIAALAYFGVLSPDRFLPEKCTFPSGTACLDFTTTNSEIAMRVQNSAGFDMNNITMYLTSPSGNSAACTGTDNSLINGEVDTFTCTPAPGAGNASGSFASGKMKAVVNLSYVNQQTTMSHIKIGELIAKIP